MHGHTGELEPIDRSVIDVGAGGLVTVNERGEGIGICELEDFNTPTLRVSVEIVALGVPSAEFYDEIGEHVAFGIAAGGEGLARGTGNGFAAVIIVIVDAVGGLGHRVLRGEQLGNVVCAGCWSARAEVSQHQLRVSSPGCKRGEPDAGEGKQEPFASSNWLQGFHSWTRVAGRKSVASKVANVNFTTISRALPMQSFED